MVSFNDEKFQLKSVFQPKSMFGGERQPAKLDDMLASTASWLKPISYARNLKADIINGQAAAQEAAISSYPGPKQMEILSLDSTVTAEGLVNGGLLNALKVLGPQEAYFRGKFEAMAQQEENDPNRWVNMQSTSNELYTAIQALPTQQRNIFLRDYNTAKLTARLDSEVKSHYPNLSPGERAWLYQNDPELKPLFDQQAVAAAQANEPVRAPIPTPEKPSTTPPAPVLASNTKPAEAPTRVKEDPEPPVKEKPATPSTPPMAEPAAKPAARVAAAPVAEPSILPGQADAAAKEKPALVYVAPMPEKPAIAAKPEAPTYYPTADYSKPDGYDTPYEKPSRGANGAAAVANAPASLLSVLQNLFSQLGEIFKGKPDAPVAPERSPIELPPSDYKPTIEGVSLTDDVKKMVCEDGKTLFSRLGAHAPVLNMEVAGVGSVAAQSVSGNEQTVGRTV